MSIAAVDAAIQSQLDQDTMLAADAVAKLLWKLEAQLDDAFATGGELAATLPRARRQARLPAVAGQTAFEQLGQALLAISAARGHTVAGHRVLEKVGRTLGYDADYGDNRPKPEYYGTGADAGHLRVVG